MFNNNKLSREDVTSGHSNFFTWKWNTGRLTNVTVRHKITDPPDPRHMNSGIFQWPAAIYITWPAFSQSQNSSKYRDTWIILPALYLNISRGLPRVDAGLLWDPQLIYVNFRCHFTRTSSTFSSDHQRWVTRYSCCLKVRNNILWRWVEWGLQKVQRKGTRAGDIWILTAWLDLLPDDRLRNL